MANPLHDLTVQEVLNKVNNYNSYQFSTLTNIGVSADRSAGLSISATAKAQELHIIDVTTGGATGPFQLTINDGDEITLIIGNLPFVWDKLPIEKIELGSSTAADDIALLAFFN